MIITEVGSTITLEELFVNLFFCVHNAHSPLKWSNFKSVLLKYEAIYFTAHGKEIIVYIV